MLVFQISFVVVICSIMCDNYKHDVISYCTESTTHKGTVIMILFTKNKQD